MDVPEAGRRPALVLTRDQAIPVLNRLVIVPATRTVRSIATEVVLDEEDGMPARCALSMDNMTIVPKSLIRRRITTLRPDRMADVCAALAAAVGCG